VLLSGCSSGKTVVDHGLGAPAVKAWNFDDAKKGKLPEGWIAEGTNQRGKVAKWAVTEEVGAPSEPYVLRLKDPKEGYAGTFNLCWTKGVFFQNGTIEVKVKAGIGYVDQGGGVMWRVLDMDNYYVASWNAMHKHFRVSSVTNGRRRTLATAGVMTDPARWHTIRVEHNGDEIKCSFNGRPLETVRDDSLPDGGGVGLWTKSDAEAAFDDLDVKGLAEAL